jgi:hypothetical protein
MPAQSPATEGASLPKLRTAVPAPGDKVDGVAVWHVGHDGAPVPDGYVLVVGSRDDAIGEARSLWQRRLKGETTGVYNGWTRIVSPGTRLTTPDQPYASTDPAPAKVSERSATADRRRGTRLVRRPGRREYVRFA